MNRSASILGLDIGTVRVGVARASWPDGIPNPLTTLTNDEHLVGKIVSLIESENALAVVAGLPRSLNGHDTAQTDITEDFIAHLRNELEVKIYTQDEAGTSLKAEAELKARKKPYSKADIDALSAVYILEDFISGHKMGGASDA